MPEKSWLSRAQKTLVGGVNSPVRAFKSVGGSPPFFVSGEGALLKDEQGKIYIDYVGSWGPMILGHAHPEVVSALQDRVRRGVGFGATCQEEVLLAEKVLSLLPGMDKIRFVNSGTEATMSALRLARGVTGRSKIVKCTGCYHGHADSLLADAGSGVATLGIPASPGVPPAVTTDTLVMPFNDLNAASQLFAEYGQEIAAVIVEPVAGNMGLVLPEPGYLSGLRALTKKHGSLFIFDEVMTGFRVAPGGAMERFEISPDLVTLGKVIGGGLPVGAYAGPAEVMDHLAPLGEVYQAGTLSGNPLAMTAGLKSLELLSQPGCYDDLEKQSDILARGLDEIFMSASKTWAPRCGSMLARFFQAGPVHNWDQASHSDTKAYAAFFHGMLKRGIALAPSQYEVMFVSCAHQDSHFQQTMEAAAASLKDMKQAGLWD